jgi:hypothetical protein
MPTAPRAARVRPRDLIPLLAYLALAVAMTWPLVVRLGTVIPHDVGDPVAFVWVLWWNAQAVPLTAEWLNPPIFYPAAGAITFQDSLLGVWPLTTGIQCLGASPLTAHNLLLLLSFPLSAFTTYLLCLHLTGDRRAAFCGGLIFGFALARFAQLAHINILLTFWMPLLLLALHRYLESRRWPWLAMAAACWALQGLTSGYFLLYSAVLVGLWAIYFGGKDWRLHVRVAVAFGLALVAIAPWLALYRSVHQMYDFGRRAQQAEMFSADIVSLLKAPPLLMLWGGRLLPSIHEDQLFPGVTLVVVVAATLAGAVRRPGRLSRLSWVLLGLAALFALVAAVGAWAPADVTLLGQRIIVKTAYKPLSWVWIALLAALIASQPVRERMARRSVPAFYALAALATWILALGPTARFGGERIWYKAPYAWLALLPGFGALRVPTRFWFLTLLAMAVLAACGLARVRRRNPALHGAAVALTAASLVLEAWPARFPLLPPPERVSLLDTPPDEKTARNAEAGSVPLLELPPGLIEQDAAAMYRATFHGRPLINGTSANFPEYYLAISSGFENRDPSAIAALAELTAFDVLLHRERDGAPGFVEMLDAAGARLAGDDGHHAIYHVTRQTRTAVPPEDPARRVAVSRITADGSDATRDLTDGDRDSAWFIQGKGTDAITAVELEMARPCRVEGIVLEMTPGPSALTIRAARAGGSEPAAWSGPLGGPLIRGTLRSPARPRVRLLFGPVEATLLSLEFLGPKAGRFWSISDIEVVGSGCR